MDILGKLFGSEAKAKIIRLFLFNPEAVYGIRDISARTDIKGNQAASAVETIFQIGLIRRKSVTREAKVIKRGKLVVKKIKEPAYFLDQKFPYIVALSDLFAAASLKADNRLAAKIMPAGKIKLIIASGIFVCQNDARIDLLVVGDDINDGKLASIIKSLETDIGRDLVYSSLTTADFQYRLGLNDRLIRDIVDYDYVILNDKIGFEMRK